MLKKWNNLIGTAQFLGMLIKNLQMYLEFHLPWGGYRGKEGGGRKLFNLMWPILMCEVSK